MLVELEDIQPHARAHFADKASHGGAVSAARDVVGLVEVLDFVAVAEAAPAVDALLDRLVININTVVDDGHLHGALELQLGPSPGLGILKELGKLLHGGDPLMLLERISHRVHAANDISRVCAP